MEILIYDEIGPDYWGMISAKSVIDQLKDAVDVTVRINSPGGSVVEAQAIYNALARHAGEVTIKIDGLAASAASYIMLAGDKIEIAENAMVMIHKAWTFAMGNAQEIRDTANILDKFDDVLLAGYVARSNGKKTRDEFSAAMDSETWFNAAESVEWGIVDAVGQPLKVAACVAPGRFRNAPKSLINPEAAKQRRNARLEAAKIRLTLAKNKQ